MIPYYHDYEFPVPHRVRPHYGVITDRYKLVHYYKPDVDDWELLDHEKDPHETKNFYNDPAYADTVKELHAELERLRKEVDDTEPPPRAAMRHRWVTSSSPASPRKNSALPSGEKRGCHSLDLGVRVS